MAGYERSQFFGLSKDQLLDYIEQQNDQLSRFEMRFRDVVRAYRGALKEKDALETTLKALSIHQEDIGTEEEEKEEEDVVEKKGGDRGESEESYKDATAKVASSDGESGKCQVYRHSDDDCGDGVTSEAEDAIKPDEVDECRSRNMSPHTFSVAQLKQQLMTLTVAMATLTEEKSKMEMNFQKDKKAVLIQQDTLTKQIQSDKDSMKRELAQFQNRLLEVQESLAKEQSSRSADQKEHGEMLKELQELISLEREEHLTLLTKMQEKEVECVKLKKHILEDRTREYEDNLRIMSVELEQVRSRLALAEKRAKEPPPLLLQLQTDLDAMKEVHLKTTAAEEKRSSEAEERLRIQAEHEESRVASLELKLSDLSKTVGSYDMQRDNDQNAILKLKERIFQLDSENNALTKALLERQGAEELQSTLLRLKALLKLATVKINERAMLPSNIEDLTISDYNELLSSQPSRKEYEQELLQLKDEFEKYKMRAQSVLRSKTGKSDSEVTNEELKKLTNLNQDLRKQLSSLRSQLDEGEEKHLIQVGKMREEMRSLHDKHKQQMMSLERSHKHDLHEIHSQMHSTRERSLKLIAERDLEIRRLRMEMGVVSPTFAPSTPLDHGVVMRRLSNSNVSSQQNYAHGSRHAASVTLAATDSGRAEYPLATQSALESEEPNNDARTLASSLHLTLKRVPPDVSSASVLELLDQQSPLPITPVGGVMGVDNSIKLLHHAQQQQRKKEEEVLARKKLFELEDTIKEVQEREQKHIEQAAFLKAEIRKLQRDRSRETENMEYLKNIVMHYMSADSSGREQLMNPIATVLHLSLAEVASIKKSISSRKWLATQKK